MGPGRLKALNKNITNTRLRNDMGKYQGHILAKTGLMAFKLGIGLIATVLTLAIGFGAYLLFR